MEVPSRITDAPTKGAESFASTTLPETLPIFWENKLIEKKKNQKKYKYSHKYYFTKF